MNAEERLAAVERYAREPDWPTDKLAPSNHGHYNAGYRNGYRAARRELRALLGIEEGT